MRSWYLEVLILLPNCRSPKLNFFFLILAIKIFLALDHKKADKWLGIHSDIGLFVCELGGCLMHNQIIFWALCYTLVMLHIHRYEKSFPWDLSVGDTMLPRPLPQSLSEWMSSCIVNIFFHLTAWGGFLANKFR